MKFETIVYSAILSVTLLSCAGGTGGGAPQDSAKKSAARTNGSGELVFKAKDGSKTETRQLDGSPSRTIECEFNPETKYAWLRMGSFKMIDGRINPSAPITGLAFTIGDVSAAGSYVIPKEVWFNVEGSNIGAQEISSPDCRVSFSSPYTSNGILSGQFSCTDTLVRKSWIIADISGKFSCPVNF